PLLAAPLPPPTEVPLPPLVEEVQEVLLQRQHTFSPTLITAVLAGSLPAELILSPLPAAPIPYRVRSTLTRGGYRVVHPDTPRPLTREEEELRQFAEGVNLGNIARAQAGQDNTEEEEAVKVAWFHLKRNEEIESRRLQYEADEAALAQAKRECSAIDLTASPESPTLLHDRASLSGSALKPHT
ncbi:hypothetical protein B484DRAFT_469228, partial [Ochromonadaceae sp. CCMP2298]